MGAIDAGQCFNPTHPPNLFLLQIWSPPMLQQMGRERVKVTQQKIKKKVFIFYTSFFLSSFVDLATCWFTWCSWLVTVFFSLVHICLFFFSWCMSWLYVYGDREGERIYSSTRAILLDSLIWGNGNLMLANSILLISWPYTISYPV